MTSKLFYCTLVAHKPQSDFLTIHFPPFNILRYRKKAWLDWIIAKNAYFFIIYADLSIQTLNKILYFV